MTNIAYLREREGLTQRELGERLGMSQSAIAQCERGSRNPSVPMIKEMMALFGVTAGQVIGTEAVDVLGI